MKNMYNYCTTQKINKLQKRPNINWFKLHMILNFSSSESSIYLLKHFLIVMKPSRCSQFQYGIATAKAKLKADFEVFFFLFG